MFSIFPLDLSSCSFLFLYSDFLLFWDLSVLAIVVLVIFYSMSDFEKIRQQKVRRHYPNVARVNWMAWYLLKKNHWGRDNHVAEVTNISSHFIEKTIFITTKDPAVEEWEYISKGSFKKYVCSNLVIFDPLPPCTLSCVSRRPPSPSYV